MATTTRTHTAPNDTSEHIQKVFKAQQHHASAVAATDAKTRIAKLKRLHAYITAEKNSRKLKEALYNDFRKTEAEVMVSEMITVTKHIEYVVKRLKKWMQPKKVSTPLSLAGTSSYVIHEPKGQCLIISPWNYPFCLAIDPLVSAIAAGNTAVIKPSEMTPHTSAFIRETIHELFEENEVAVIEGDAEIATQLLDLPFNHIFFTGSPQIGKIVMEAAAKHLASVTLELGGKSPAIIDGTVNPKETAEKLAWAKLFNKGQTCIAPDYALVHTSIKDKLLAELQQAVTRMYDPGQTGIQNSASYCRMVNNRHFGRVKHLLDDAVEKGATVVFGGETDATDDYIAPTVLTDVTEDMKIMQEEIFGPLLPVLEYTEPEEVIDRIGQRERPLALYIASKNEAAIRYFQSRSTAGGTVINDYMLHFANPALPFGGINNSGLGKSHGYFGFEEFSNQRAVVRQKWGTMKPIYPPYNSTVSKVLKLLLRFG